MSAWLLFLGVALGVAAGSVTGLTPGIHVNLVTALLLSAAPTLAGRVPPLVLACFVISMAVVHTFLDSIPSIFLGAPDAATALGVLPGHRYVLKGWGLMAVKLTVLGSLGAAILSLALFPLFLWLVRVVYPFFRAVMGWLLLGVAAFMIGRDARRAWAALVFLLSGALGLLVFDLSFSNPLFPLLSGLFGVSTLLYGLRGGGGVPPQVLDDHSIAVRRGIAEKAILAGQASGFLTAMLPGLGSATAAVVSLQFVRDLGDHGYLVLQGAINTVNFLLSLATLWVLGKARNGAVAGVQQLVKAVPAEIVLFLAVALVAAGAGTILALVFGRWFARLVTAVPERALSLGVVVLLVVLTPVLSSWTGLLVLVTATAIGLIPAVVKTARVHAMGCILLPVMLYFL